MSGIKQTVGVDWGSSSFRAYRFDANAELIDKIDTAAGIKTVTDQDFESVLMKHIGHWLQANDSIVLSGMITSRNGWLETPYLKCPLSFFQLLQQSVRLTVRNNIEALFLPGACVEHPADVMRGEELQLYGATQQQSQLVVLPGTHSKWAYVRDGVLQKFHTVVTGELFDALINHTLVGSLASEALWIENSFNEGVQSGYASDAIVSQLFTARSRVLLEQLQPEQVHSYLSGLLIGNEIRESQLVFPDEVNRLLVGSDMLVERYSKAFAQLDIAVEAESRDAACMGFQKLIKQVET